MATCYYCKKNKPVKHLHRTVFSDKEFCSEKCFYKYRKEKKHKTDYNQIGVILGVVGLVVLPLLFGIIAVIFGAIAKGKGSEKNGAIILGIVDIVWWYIALAIGFTLF